VPQILDLDVAAGDSCAEDLMLRRQCGLLFNSGFWRKVERLRRTSCREEREERSSYAILGAPFKIPTNPYR